MCDKPTLIKLYKGKILNKINSVYPIGIGRPLKYSHKYCVNKILKVLFYGYSWNSISNGDTIRKRLNRYRELNIFDDLNNEFRQIYFKNRSFQILSIDSTVIENNNCSNEMIDFYYKIKTKKQLKLSVISTNNLIPLSYEISNPKHHDCTFIEPLINKLDTKNIKNKCILLGDKGYIYNKQIFKINKKRIKLITSKRKNQKKNTKNDKKMLNKHRFSVESFFSSLKRTYKRLSKVYERNIDNFKLFLTMALSCQILRKL
jgi:transposase